MAEEVEKYEEEDQGFTLTTKGLQIVVDDAGRRFDESEPGSMENTVAVASLLVFSQYCQMRGWEMLNRLVIGEDVT